MSYGLLLAQRLRHVVVHLALQLAREQDWHHRALELGLGSSPRTRGCRPRTAPSAPAWLPRPARSPSCPVVPASVSSMPARWKKSVSTGPGCSAVTAYPRILQLIAQAVRKREHERLRRRVDGLPRRDHLAGDRRGKQNPTRAWFATICFATCLAKCTVWAQFRLMMFSSSSRSVSTNI